MAPPRQIVDWLNRTYPKPKVDPEWLDACYNWIISNEDSGLNPATDMERIIRNVEVQLLGSSLSDSMLPGTGLPPNISSMNNTTLPFGRIPILVEIVSIMEVGNSAFSLLNTRQTRLDRADLAGLGGDEAEDEAEGPIPKYPRSMLKLELSDGVTVLKAMEYQRLPELELGVTPLGYKMLLKDVFIREGVAWLEPNSVVIKGSKTDDLEELQDANFVRNLRIRLGRDPGPEPENIAVAAPPQQVPDPPPAVNGAVQHVPPAQAVIRSPLRDLPDPLEVPVAGPSNTYHDDDENQPRRRRIPNSQQSQLQQPGSSTFGRSSYFAQSSDTASSSISALGSTRLFSPRRSANTELLNSPREAASSDFGDDIEFDDAIIQQLDMIEQEASIAQNGLVGNGSSESASSITISDSASRGTSLGSTSTNLAEVITIEDEDDEDKENVPVDRRRVRRRYDHPVGDIIDISD